MRRTAWLAPALAFAAAAPLVGVVAGAGDEAPVGVTAQEPAQAESALAYHAARIWHEPGAPHPYLDHAYLLVRGGKVVAVVADAASLPPLVQIVDLGEAVIVPGLVAADSSYAGTGQQGDHSLGAHRRAIDDFDSFEDLDKVLERGVTTFYVSPSRNRLVGGRGAVVKAAGEARVVRALGDLRVSLTSAAQSPPRFFRPPLPPTEELPIEPLQPQLPTSRAGALMALRETGRRARQQSEVFDAHRTALAAWMEERAPLRVAAQDSGEVRGALEIAAEWKVRLIVDGAAEAAAHAARLAEAKAQVIFDVPLFLSTPDLAPDWSWPERGALRELRAAGVPVALGVGVYGRWTLLLEAAAAAVGYGLTESEALAGVTTVAAEVLGVADRVGGLQPGLDADFVVLSGDPLDPASSVQQVYVNGRRAWSAAAHVRDPAVAAVVLRAGTLWTGHGPPLSGGAEVLLQNGKIVAAGVRVPHPPGARVIDAGPHAHLTPGFIDAGGRLGLGRSSPNAQSVVGLLGAGSEHRRSWRAVARSGVTTMVLEPNSKSANGTRTQAVKTAARLPGEAWVQGRDIVFFNAQGGDRAGTAERLRGALRQGKAYFDKWEKYRKERAEWETKDAEKQQGEQADAEASLRERLARGLEKAEEEEPVEAEAETAAEGEAAAKVEVDPINGLWEATIEDERFPESVTVQARVRHEGARLTAVLSAVDFPEQGNIEVEGTWDAGAMQMRVQVDSEIGPIVAVAEVDAPDHANVTISLAGFGSVEFEANRLEVDDGSAAMVVSPRKRRAKEEGPQPPKINWGLEGQRALFEKRAVAVVQVDRADEIRTVVEVFGEFELPVHLQGASEALEVAPLLRESGVGVVISPALVQREENRDFVPAAELRAAGVQVAFRSGAEGGARFLADALALSTRYGLGAEQALEGLTSHAADLLGLGGRVGRIAPGHDGDVVIHSGPPLDLRSHVLHVFVNGREVGE